MICSRMLLSHDYVCIIVFTQEVILYFMFYFVVVVVFHSQNDILECEKQQAYILLIFVILGIYTIL